MVAISETKMRLGVEPVIRKRHSSSTAPSSPLTNFGRDSDQPRDHSAAVVSRSNRGSALRRNCPPDLLALRHR